MSAESIFSKPPSKKQKAVLSRIAKRQAGAAHYRELFTGAGLIGTVTLPAELPADFFVVEPSRETLTIASKIGGDV